MFLAIMKQLTVVGEPSMTSMEMSLSFVNPRAIAIGRNIAHQTMSLSTAAVTAGFSLPKAFLISKLAPTAISPIGVLTFERYLTVFISI